MNPETDRWEWVEMPVGPHPLPVWCTGLEVGWSDGYGNLPDICLKTNTDAREWPKTRFVVEDGDHYRAYSGDGRLEQHSHSGQLTWQEGQRAWVSSPDEGYGGAHWTIMMRPYLKVEREGKKRWNRYDEWSEWKDTYFFRPGYDKVILVGPWSVSAPKGWRQVSYVDTSRPDIYGNRHWTKRTARAGLYITDDLWLRLIARFAPHLRVARTFYKWANFDGILEPVRGNWDEPKLWAMRSARNAA